MLDENQNTPAFNNMHGSAEENAEIVLEDRPLSEETATDDSQPQTYQHPPQFTPEKQPKKKKKKHKNSGAKIISLALCFSLLGGVAGSVITYFAKDLHFLDRFNGSTTIIQESHRENVKVDVNTVDPNKEMSPAEVYATNVNSTVGIKTAVTTNYWGYQTTLPASGSGFIISADGYILTNYHVVEDSTSITVSFFDGTSAKAKLVGYDERNDIAVLKADAQGLTPVTFGDSDNMNVGDTVLAIGNPLGELTFTLTSGIVSALNRKVTTSNGVTMSLMQTDCAINSGNSGGALFNLYGEVIGITNAKYSSNGSSEEASIDNIGFAIPMNQVKSIVESIIEKGYYSKPYIGVSVVDVSEETQSYGLPKGAAIKTITEGAPAEKAGLQINDIITKVDTNEITNSNDLVTIVGKATIGQTLKLTVYRMGAYIELELTVGEQKQNTTPQNPSSNQNNFFNPFG